MACARGGVLAAEATTDSRRLPDWNRRFPWTDVQVRDAVPAHLFERSMFWSFFHTFVDLVKVAVTGYAMWAMDTSSLPLAAKLVLWPVLWYIQGAFMTGIWVIAHECGHQAFSASRAVNDAVGMVLVSEAADNQLGESRGCRLFGSWRY